MKPLVSVIMPSYNAEQFIQEAMNSVLSQSCASLELIVIDDASTDGTRALILETCKKDQRVQEVFLTTNSGTAIARNKGIAKAKGTWIAFLDADDVWATSKLELQLKMMEEENVLFSYTNYDFMDEGGEKTINETSFKATLTYKDLLKTNFIGCLTVVYHQDTLGKIYMPILDKRQDYGTWLAILKMIPEAKGIDQKLAFYRVRRQSISSNKFEMLLWNWKLFYEIEQLGFWKSLQSLTFNIFYKIFRK